MPVYPSINSSWHFFPYILANNAIIIFQSLMRLVNLKADPGGFIYGGTEWLLSLDRWAHILQHLNRWSK